LLLIFYYRISLNIVSYFVV